MIKIFIKDNLFDEDKVLKQSHEWSGKTLKEYLPNGEWIINLDGQNIVDTDIIVPEYAQIVLTPKVEAPAIAAWVVSAVGAVGVAATVVYAATWVVATLLISYVGGLLMNAILGGQKSDSDSQLTESSPTYSWTGASTLPRIGTPIPVLYGTHALSGNIIQRRIESVGDDQYLYLLLALCEGKIDDITIDKIKIDNTPLSNFTNVEWFFRNGTIDQEVIQYFGDTETPNNMSVKCLYNVPVIRQTIGNAIEAFRIDLQFPSGLYYSNDRGGLDTRSVFYNIEYRKVGDVSWIDIGQDIYDTIYHEAVYDGDGWIIQEAYSSQVLVGHGFRASGAKNTKISVSHRVDNLAYGQYEVRVTRQTVDNVNTRQKDDMYIANIGEIIYDDLYYPNIALFGLKIKANDQLSGNDPTVSIECTRSDIEVFNESGVSQGFKKLNNPAWVAYDVLTNQDYGAGYNYNRVEYDKLLEWANWNDELLSDGKGGLEKRNLFDGVFDSESNVWDSLAKVATCGRAGMFIKGTKYIPIIDKPSLPVQMFNMGNIKKGSFTTSYIGTEDLATEIEIQFTNKDNDYAKDTLSVMVPEYFNQTDYSNKVTINQIGVTRQSQAYRSGKYFLGCNKYQYRTVSFECGVDAIACSVGDVAYVAHDVPAWGKSGRTVGVGTINSVVLDESVPLVSGIEYTLLLRQNVTDVIDKRTFIASSTTTTQNITVSSNFTAIPTEYSIYTLFQSSNGAQLFRITNITRTTEQERKITAIDYNESLLNDSTTIVPTTSSSISLAPHVTSSLLKEHLEIKPTGALQSFIDFEWTCEGVYRDFDIMISKDNGANYNVIAKNVITLNHSYNATELEEGRQYLFKIVPRNLNREALELATVIPYTFLGKLAKPNPITNLKAESTSGKLVCSWDKSLDLDFSYYQIETQGKTYTTVLPYITLDDIEYRESILNVYVFDTSKIKSDATSVTYSHRERSVIDLISDSYQIEQGFLDGKINMYWGIDEPIPENNYDLWVIQYNMLSLQNYSFGSKFLNGKTYSFFESGVQYKYYLNGYWYACTDEQATVIQRMLRYVSQSSVIDGLVRIFNREPFAPYSIGDLWIEGDTVKICTTSKDL